MPSNSIEQQALERASRMYSSFERRENRPDNAPRNRPIPQMPAEPINEAPKKTENSEKELEHPITDKRQGGFLEKLMEDKEQSLLLLLLVILIKDGADLNLILALMYIII